MLNKLVSITDSKAVTTSLIIAEAFDKQHKNVLQAIENIEAPEEFNRLNFQPVGYTDAKGEVRKMYNITRDGFMLVAMGFTGKKATEFKIRFIEAFNAMEQALLEQHGVDRRVEVKHNHVRGITNPHGLEIDYRIDLTKFLNNPNPRGAQILGRIMGIDMSDLAEDWEEPPAKDCTAWVYECTCESDDRTLFSYLYQNYLDWFERNSSGKKGVGPSTNRGVAKALRSMGFVLPDPKTTSGNLYVIGLKLRDEA